MQTHVKAGRLGRRARIGRLGAAIMALVLGCQVAHAQQSDPSPKTGLEKPVTAAPSGLNGPLAPIFAPLAARGITFHALALDFAEVNPSLGLQRGRGANSAYISEGVDVDLGIFAGLAGTSLHFTNIFFAGVRNLNIAPEIGDSQVGYQPPFTPRVARLSQATIEQKLLDDKLDIQIGATHPGYFYADFNCGSINTCFQDILYLNAGYTSYGFAVPGANVTYHVTPSVYIETGAFAVQPNANYHVGYDFPDEEYNGVLAMGEIGSKTTFATDPYPYHVSLTGFFNTANHVDYNAATAFTGVTQTSSGTAGIVVQGEKIVWRQDHGLDPTDKAPTALKLYGSVGTALDSTIPIEADMWVGATLLSPFAGRPDDHFGVKFNYERLNPSYTQYITAANLVSGGFGSPYSPNKYVFEANAHIALPLAAAFEPVVQYAVNPNSYFNPLTPVKAHDGVYLGGTLVVPLGVILGLGAPT